MNFSVPRRSRPRILLFVLCIVLPGVLLPGAAAPPAPATFPWQPGVWQHAADLLVDDALDKLPPARSAHDGAERRELDYARGVLLLNAQPKLQRNIDEARALLESVRQARPDDEPGLNALYALARIAQYHADPPDPSKAAALYSQLVATAPDHPIAQAAVSRLAMLRLYEESTPEARRERVEEFEKIAARLSIPSARRDLHFVLADASLVLMNDSEGAMRHLLAAEEAGIAGLQLAGETQVRIALLARQLGHREIAIAHYRKFLSLFQRDGRSYVLALQLRELESAGAGPAAPAASAALSAGHPDTPSPSP